MALDYKLEFNTPSGSADDAVFIHIRKNVPVYENRIDKEDYDVLPVANKHVFLTGIFNVAGVVEVSSRAYRVWVMKSPVYTWQEVINPVLNSIASSLGESTLNELPGSGRVDGTGTRLGSADQRRSL